MLFKILIAINTISWSASSLLIANYEQKNIATIFEKIKQANDRITPSQYQAEIKSTLIASQFKTIPPDMIIFGKRPYALFRFKKQSAIKLKVLNVQTYYETMLQLYEEILVRSGILFGINEFYDYPSFNKNHQVTWDSQNQKLQVKEKEALSGNYAWFYLDDNFLMTRSEYYEAHKKVATAQFNWINQKKYRLVKTIKIKFIHQNKTQLLDLEFNRFRF